MPGVNPPKAVHLEGGNHFSDIKLDIAKSVSLQEEWLSAAPKRSVRRSAVRNYFSLGLYLALSRIGLWEPAVNCGLVSGWFTEFRDYWFRSLDGRPITLMDFHGLRFLFRTRFAQLTEFAWDDSTRHLRNWQLPLNIHAILFFVFRAALEPLRCGTLLKVLKPGMRVLEFGCSIAPMYRTWRKFWSHVATEWVLADIPNFPFHYARHVYSRDREASFCLIAEELFDEPLKNVAGSFDLIILQEVFEHLHKPLQMAGYLLDRLKPGGLFYFDYIRSDAKGHDTPAGLHERIPTLQFLSDKLEIVSGNFEVSDKSLGRCIGRKRA